MAALPQSYDPRDHNPDDRPDPFPAGRVRQMILDTDVKRTATGTGSYLWIEHQVQGGPHDGRKFWNQITLENPNSQAVEIGQRQLSALCHSVGYLQALTNSDVLHGRSGEVDVEVEPAGTKNGKSFPAKNVVKRYILPGDTNHAPGGKPSQQSQAAPSNGRQKRAWE